MWQGEVMAIHIAAEAAGPMQPVTSVAADVGRGLAGDRYWAGQGTYSRNAGPKRQVTLIEQEAVEALAQESDLRLDPGASRRNILTRGVPLNHLVDREFLVGEVRLRGVMLCEPCRHLERLSGKKGVRAALVHRGGLNAEVVGGGTLHVGDAVRPVE